MRSEGDFDVVGMGLNAIDHICIIPRFPKYDEKLRMVDFRRSPGGQVASALVACSRWGLRARYIGKFGGDEMGDFSYKSLESEGIDLTYCKRIDGALNQFAFIMVDQQTGERTIIWKRDERLAITPDEVSIDAIASGRYLLLDGHDALAASRAASQARERDIKVVIDGETIKDGTKELIRSSDYLVCTRGFAKGFSGLNDLDDAIDSISAVGVNCVVVTLGKDGAIARVGKRDFRSHGFKVKCVDSTGAGDVFHGAFVYGLSRGWEIEKILDFSNAAAALNCTELGARGGIKPLDQIFDLMRNGERW